MSVLQTVWWLLVGVLLTVYAVLDGFDLGVGIFHPFARSDAERRALLRTVGPVWDGNEVWLLTGAGALFAAFPPVYASVLSGLYLPLMILLVALILRAVSFEFRNKEESRRWRALWDGAFAFGSAVPALLFGIVVGNLLAGLPLSLRGDYSGNLQRLLTPFAVLVGLQTFFVLAQQGATWAWMKTEGELAERARGWSLFASGLSLLLFIGSTASVLRAYRPLLDNFVAFPALWVLPVLVAYALGCTFWFAWRGRAGQAFLFSSISIVGQMALFGASVFPNLLRAANDASRSLTAYNSSSSLPTLRAMLIIGLLGLPFVAGYTIWVYRKFRGTVRTDGE